VSLKLAIPERIASDVDVYVRDPAHADPLIDDEEERAFLRARAAIMAGWRAHSRGADLTLPDDRAVLLDVHRVMMDLSNRDDASPVSASAYLRITLAIIKAAENLKGADHGR